MKIEVCFPNPPKPKRYMEDLHLKVATMRLQRISGCFCAMWAFRLETVERCLLQIEHRVFPLCLLTWL